MACRPSWVTLLNEPPLDLLDDLDNQTDSLERENNMFRGARNIKFISLLEDSNSSGLDDAVSSFHNSSFPLSWRRILEANKLSCW